jgi:hypothetical protein
MLRCASSLVIAAYTKVRLIPHDSRALPAAFLQSRPIFIAFKTFYETVIIPLTHKIDLHKLVSLKTMPYKSGGRGQCDRVLRAATRLAGVSHHQRKRGSPMQDLQEKVTFITGGGRGPGQELSRCCIACVI